MSGKSFFGLLTMRLNFAHDVQIDDARSIGDFLFLRRLRNRVRHVMTNDPAWIGILRQIGFYRDYRRKFKGTQSIRIYIARFQSQRVGYLLIRLDDDAARITVAVDQRFRRSGIAKSLIRHAQRHHGDLIAEIRDDNSESIALHETMGFKKKSRSGSVLIYGYTRS
jgi:GNAT superfamily N-acetyltransferase